MRADEFTKMMAEVLEVEPTEVTHASILSDFQVWDSVCALTLMVRLEEDAKVTCTPEQLAEFKSVGDVAELIRRDGKLEE